MASKSCRLRHWFVSLVAVCALLGCSRSSSAPGGERSATTSSALSAFVQTNFTNAASVTVPFTAAQTAGDLNVLVVGWNDTVAKVTSVTDVAGNSYTLAVGPVGVPGTLSQAIYYAKNIAAAAANANVATVYFSAKALLCRLPGCSAAGSFRNTQRTRLESVLVFAKHRSDASGHRSARLHRDSERGAPGCVRSPLGDPSSSIGRWTSRGPRSIAHGAARRERSAASAAYCGGPRRDATGLSPARARPPRPARTPRARVAASHPARTPRDRPSLAS